jgi:serine phosphatase RsbU (regulator of sigma subunit)
VPDRRRAGHHWFLLGLVALVVALVVVLGVELLVGDAVPAPIAVGAGVLVAVLAAVAVAATVQRDRRERELRRSRPAVLLQELSRHLVWCRTRDEVVAAFDAWAETVVPAARVELWLGPDLTPRVVAAGPLTIPLRGPSGGIGVMRVEGDVGDEELIEGLLTQAAGLVSIALDRSEFVDEVTITTRRLEALQEATLRLAEAERVEDVASVAVDAGRKALDADVSILYERRGGEAHLLDSVGLDLVGVETTDPDEESLETGDRFSLGSDAPTSELFVSGSALRLDSRADIDARYGYLVTSDDRIEQALVAAPVEIEGVVAAVLYLGFGHPRTLSADDLVLLDSLSTLVAHALRRARQMEEEGSRRQAAMLRARRAELLDGLTEALADAEDPMTVAQRFVDRAIPAISATWGAVFGLEHGDRALRLVAVHELDEGYAPRELPLAERVALTDAVHECRAVLLGTVDEILDRYPAAPLSDGEAAWAAVPMMVDGDVIGVMGLGFSEPQHFDAEYEAFLVAAGERMAHAFERARHRERQRREEHRWAMLAQVGELVAAPSRPHDVLLRFVRWAVPEIADALAVYVTRDDGTVAVASYVDAPEAEETAAQLDRFPVDLREDHPLGAVLQNEKAMVVDPLPPELVARIVNDPSQVEIVAELDLERALVVPLISSGAGFGVLAAAMGRSRRSLDDDHVRLITDLASRLALAYDNAYRLEAERRIALTVQSALLPAAVPVVRGLEVAVRYEAAGARAGGDWYDVVSISEHVVGLAVGDVVGHGIAASAEMARYRSALRSYALMRSGPQVVMELLRRFAQADEFETMATILYGEIDTERSTFTYSLAGHPFPLLIRNGAPVILGGGHGPPIGVDSVGDGSTSIALELGDVLVLYTDGLIERRGEIIDAGFERLAAVARCHASAPLSALCDNLISELVDEEPRDDIAIVAVRMLRPTD